jgi:glycine/D-amino acid oxidase-like deaminating enzyme
MPDGTALEAGHLVVAGGAADIDHALAPGIPLRAVHGESLLVHIDGLVRDVAIVCGHHLAPRGEGAGTWSCGGTKTPDLAAATTTARGREELERFLAGLLSVPWSVTEHRAGVRATTPDRKPVVGAIEHGSRVLVFNGLGSQGLWFAPWLARELAGHIADGRPLPEAVRADRFNPTAVSVVKRDATD